MPYIHDPVYPQRNADHDVVRQLLGLRHKEKLPAGGLPVQVIQGIEVWVEPLRPQRTVIRYGVVRVVKSSKHRVLARCPICAQVLSAGRLHQHKCKPPKSRPNARWVEGNADRPGQFVDPSQE